MESSYKRLGDYIQEVNIRNKELLDIPLLGVSITKKFIPSIANIIGTDMSTYKLIVENQFAYGPVTSRNGNKISIALSDEHDNAMVSQAYTVFEVIDKNQVLPEYLMMWFRRTEFDRYARFMSHGSAREIFSWAELCDTLLPIPSPEKQREIVKEYHVIQNRIALNNQLIDKLEETAQTIYKQWFVDFEFPDDNGKPYKTTGGKMEWCAELGKDVPVRWILVNIGSIIKQKGYIRGPFGSALKKDDMVPNGIPVYEQQHAIDDHRNFRYFVNEEKHKTLKRFTVEVDDFIISCSGTIGKITVIRENDPIGVINQALLILRIDKKKLNPICFKYFLLSSEGNKLLIADAAGSAQVNMAKREQIVTIPLIIPIEKELLKVSKYLNEIDNMIYIKIQECLKIKDLKELLLARMTKVESEIETVEN
jgi:type I restriction enzyme S subunit